MTRRLVERYAPGDRVLIRFEGSAEWLPGQVVRLDHPGVWVATADGRPWFVTNGSRIRKATPSEGDD